MHWGDKQKGYLQSTEPPVERGIKLGTRADRDRRTAFSFDFTDGERRTFLAFTEEQALEDAKVYGLAHGRIAPVD